MTNNFMGSTIIEQDMQEIYGRSIDWTKLYEKNVLITGATGMLASYLIFFLIYLNENYHSKINIIALVRNEEKCHKIFGAFAQKEYFSIITADVNKPLHLMKKVDYIVHAAGLASPQYYGSMPVEVASSNVLGTYYLLQLAREKQIKGFLFFSSGDVYGKMPPEVTEITEDMSGMVNPLDEHSCYTESKRMGETWCSSFFREYNVPANIVRIAHTYSPTMDIENDPRVFASFMKCIYHEQNIVMLSDGTAKRPFCYIVDAVAAFFLVLLEGEHGTAYNMCNSNEFLSMSELANIIIGLRPELNLKVICKQRSIDENYVENKVNKANKPIETKLKKMGWECHYDSRRGFNNVLQYLLEQKS